jgi:hypothetical protein
MFRLERHSLIVEPSTPSTSIQDYLLLEEEFIQNQERPGLNQGGEERRRVKSGGRTPQQPVSCKHSGGDHRRRTRYHQYSIRS